MARGAGHGEGWARPGSGLRVAPVVPPWNRRPDGRGTRLGALVTLVCGLASLLGYAVFDSATPEAVTFVLAFAGGAILTMLADTMMPEAFEHGGKLVGLATTLE
jgi:zinc transporter ZupT